MSVANSKVTVGTTAVALNAVPALFSNRKPIELTVQNPGANAVFIGATNGVTTTAYGYKIAAGGEKTFKLNGSDALYAIAGQAGNDLFVLAIAQ